MTTVTDLEKELYQEMDLPDLETFLQGFDEVELRKMLLTLFQKYEHYRNLTEWNKVVRICEALAITGWGEAEGLEAHHLKYYNGNPYTCFLDSMDRERGQFAIWSKAKAGFTLKSGWVHRKNLPGEKAQQIEDVKPEVQSGSFADQRNWLSRNPVKPKVFIQNAWPELIFIREKLAELRAFLNARLSGHRYGKELRYIYLDCRLSSEYARYGSGKITPDYTLGRFQKKTGIYTIEYYFPRAFGEQTELLQIKQLKEDILEMVEIAAEKLKKNCPAFNFDQLKKDLQRHLNEWP